MTDTEKMQEDEMQQFAEFKRRINLQAAQSQVTKIEYDLTSAVTEKDFLRRACQDANMLKLGAVCVLPCMVKMCANFLGSNPQTSLIACISQPHGGDTTSVKVKAVKTAVKDGADEAEVTAPIAFIREKNWSYVKHEFKKLKRAAKKSALRINIESGLLTREEISKVCSIAADCGITSLRSSSGTYGGIFETDSIAHMHSVVKDKCTLKAEGVATVTDMMAAINTGAGIIGSKNAIDLARLILQTAV